MENKGCNPARGICNYFFLDGLFPTPRAGTKRKFPTPELLIDLALYIGISV